MKPVGVAVHFTMGGGWASREMALPCRVNIKSRVYHVWVFRCGGCMRIKHVYAYVFVSIYVGVRWMAI